MTQIDTVFIVYGFLTILLIIMTYVILRKSLSTVNYLFSITPLAFGLVLVLNMLQYFVSIPDFYTRVPYLLAPLGILFAGIYIFRGKEIFQNYYFIFITVLYIAFCIFISFYDGYRHSNLTSGFLHLTITFPAIVALVFYYRIRFIIPESARSIDSLLIGVVIVIFGALLRSYYFFTTTNATDYIPGLAIILIGTIIIILSFTAFSGTQSKSTTMDL